MSSENKTYFRKTTPNYLHFSFDIVEKGLVSHYYSKMVNVESEKLIHDKLNATSKLNENTFLLIEEVPNYLDVEINTQLKAIKIKKIDTYKGSLINLGDYNDLNGYLTNEISKKRKATLNRCQRRLDLCLQPEYKMFYGDISKSDYDEIFHAYKYMLQRRLAQKKSYWEELDYWDDRYAETYQLIQDKKACIYAIYSENKPIAIYINSVFQNILYIEVVAYDIDYSKFKLGFLTLAKVIEWAILNSFDLIDMSKGDFYYKERFRNGEYTFQKHLIYDSRNLFTSSQAFLLWLKLSMIYRVLPTFKKLRVYKWYKIFTDKRKKAFLKEYILPSAELSVEKENEKVALDQLEVISIANNQYSFLRRTFMDFLFNSFEFVGDVSVYKSNNKKGTFFFKGKKEIYRVAKLDVSNNG